MRCWQDDGCYQREEWWAYGANVADDRVTALAGYRWPYKLLWQNRRRSGVFDVASDPFENRELSGGGKDAATLPREAARLQASFERNRRALQARLEERDRDELSPEQLQMLQDLGYL